MASHIPEHKRNSSLPVEVKRRRSIKLPTSVSQLGDMGLAAPTGTIAGQQDPRCTSRRVIHHLFTKVCWEAGSSLNHIAKIQCSHGGQSARQKKSKVISKCAKIN